VKIINRLPYFEEDTYLTVGDTPVQVRRYQIVVWVSLNEHPFPAILDTGHSHNFTISRSQLRRFTGLDSMPVIGHTEVNRQPLPQVEADLWLHGNRSGTRERSGKKIPLNTEEGITLFPDAAPRLPLLGLRAITRSGLTLVINGKRREVTLRTGWL
jgi:hypothetical protein